MGPISYFGEAEINVIGNREFASPSRCDRVPIGEIELIRVSGSGLCQVNSVAPDRSNRWGRV